MFCLIKFIRKQKSIKKQKEFLLKTLREDRRPMFVGKGEGETEDVMPWFRTSMGKSTKNEPKISPMLSKTIMFVVRRVQKQTKSAKNRSEDPQNRKKSQKFTKIHPKSQKIRKCLEN